MFRRILNLFASDKSKRSKTKETPALIDAGHSSTTYTGSSHSVGLGISGIKASNNAQVRPIHHASKLKRKAKNEKSKATEWPAAESQPDVSYFSRELHCGYRNRGSVFSKKNEAMLIEADDQAVSKSGGGRPDNS